MLSEQIPSEELNPQAQTIPLSSEERHQPPGWPAEAKHDATPTPTPLAATAVRSDDAAIVQAQQTSHGAGSDSRLAPESDSRGIAALGQEEEDATRLAARAMAGPHRAGVAWPLEAVSRSAYMMRW